MQNEVSEQNDAVSFDEIEAWIKESVPPEKLAEFAAVYGAHLHMLCELVLKKQSRMKLKMEERYIVHMAFSLCYNLVNSTRSKLSFDDFLKKGKTNA